MFFTVFAFPNASNKGLESRTYVSIDSILEGSWEELYPGTWSSSLGLPINMASLALAMYERMILQASVFPDPDSPVIMID